jgi:hypothetical protein
MATFKEAQQLVEKAGVDAAKIKISGSVFNEIREQVKDLAFIQLLNKKPEINAKK